MRVNGAWDGADVAKFDTKEEALAAVRAVPWWEVKA